MIYKKDNQLYQEPSSQVLEGTGLELQVPFLPNIASAVYPIPISKDGQDKTDDKKKITLMGKNLTAVIQKYLTTL